MNSDESANRAVRILLRWMLAGAFILLLCPPAFVWYGNYKRYQHEREIASRLTTLDPNAKVVFWLPGNSWAEPLLRHFDTFKTVGWVAVGGERVTSSDVECLSSFANLESLELQGDQIGDSALVHVGKITTLRYLSFWECSITDRGLFHLRGLNSLEKVSADYTGVCGEGLRHLSNLPSLRVVRLSGPAVTDAAIDGIKTLGRLETLEMYDTSLSPGGVERLRESLPNTEVVVD